MMPYSILAACAYLVSVHALFCWIKCRLTLDRSCIQCNCFVIISISFSSMQICNHVPHWNDYGLSFFFWTVTEKYGLSFSLCLWLVLQFKKPNLDGCGDKKENEKPCLFPFLWSFFFFFWGMTLAYYILSYEFELFEQHNWRSSIKETCCCIKKSRCSFRWIHNRISHDLTVIIFSFMMKKLQAATQSILS